MHFGFSPSAPETEKLLLSKGINNSYLDYLKRNRRVMNINWKLYDELEFRDDILLNIPVSKIISTPRTEGSYRTWWDNIFNPKFNNINENKWEEHISLLKGKTLEEFKISLYIDAPPLPSVIYYPDYDVYEVYHDAHHRTVWAILTNTPFLKAKELRIWRLNKNAYSERRSFYQNALVNKREYFRLEKNMRDLLNLYDLNYELTGNRYNVYFKDYYITSYLSYRKKELIACDNKDMEENKWSFIDLKDAYSKVDSLINYHNKINFLPNFIKRGYIKIKCFFNDNYLLEQLHQLYKHGWNG